jgi:hypothetical protein
MCVTPLHASLMASADSSETQSFLCAQDMVNFDAGCGARTLVVAVLILTSSVVGGEAAKSATESVVLTPGTENFSTLIDAKNHANYYAPVPCRTSFPLSTCHPNNCGRRVVDEVFSNEDIEKLHYIAEKGMSSRPSLGGPTILDINTGYIRDTAGMENLFMKSQAVYSDDDFGHYGRIIAKLKETVAETFQIKDLYFTAPTFITRLDAAHDWQPRQIHDEYWHPHADHNNTEHYHYSGLLYMSTYGEDFTGGRFSFIKPEFSLFNTDDASDTAALNAPTDEDVELTVEPRAGRVVIFTAGHENTHLVERLQSGQRFVLSFWFTCDPAKEFEIFLDGQAHTTFSHRVRDTARRRASAAKATAAKTEL